MGVPIVFRDGPWKGRDDLELSVKQATFSVEGYPNGWYQYVGAKETEDDVAIEVYYDWKQDGT